MLIKNARLVTWEEPNRVLADHALLIESGRILSLGPSRTLEEEFLRGAQTRGSESEVVDARGQLVFPGNICAHTHFYGAFARGMAIGGDPPADFPHILRISVTLRFWV
jgi:cytosine/adenosine deaminase-related metal-dependent hydrolase